jgi:[protein]-arginine 3-hydroxylase / protease
VLYLAQHQLFEQIPALRKDIVIPDYCSLGWSETAESNLSAHDPTVNAWFGPRGTVSPLHFDANHNLLCQVVGKKYIRLYAPSTTPLLYANPESSLANTSMVDVENPDARQFPAFLQAPYVETILDEGQTLYIPPRWWHFVKSLSTSWSVSFWW